MWPTVRPLGPCKLKKWIFLTNFHFFVQDNIENALTHEEIDQAAGVLFPFYDAESDVIYVAGKGDTSIR